MNVVVNCVEVEGSMRSKRDADADEEDGINQRRTDGRMNEWLNG